MKLAKVHQIIMLEKSSCNLGQSDGISDLGHFALNINNLPVAQASD